MQLSAKVKHHYCCVCCFQRFSSENLSSRWKTRNNISLRLIYNAKSHENARVIRIHRQEWCDYFNLSGKHFCGWRQSYWQRGMAKATPTQGSTWMNSRSWVRPLESTSRVFSLTSMSVCKMASVLSRRLSVSWVDSRCSFSWSRVFFSSITSFCSLHRKSHDIRHTCWWSSCGPMQGTILPTEFSIQLPTYGEAWSVIMLHLMEGPSNNKWLYIFNSNVPVLR